MFIEINYKDLQHWFRKGEISFHLPYTASNNNPENTIKVPIHCLGIKLLPKKITEPRTVKNFLVVVMIEQGKGPKSATVRNIKYCPRAPAMEKDAMCQREAGCLCKNPKNSDSSPDNNI